MQTLVPDRGNAKNTSPGRHVSISEPIDHVDYWLGRAEEIQTIADGLRDPHARQLILDLAKTYKPLAERAGERAKRS